jgi:PIN domain nuclease of toxin-antitoxin system
MRLLLDTNALVWWLEGGEELSEAAREAIAAPTSDVAVSAASVWEASIKRAKGRLQAPERLLDWIRKEGFTELPIGYEHASLAGELPPHHADPFDRVLIAQARVEGLTIVTRDAAFEAYGVPLLPA